MLCPRFALGQVPAPGLSVKSSSRTGQPIFVTAAGGGPIPVQATGGRAQPEPMDFLRQHGAVFGIKDPATELTQRTVKTDAFAHLHTTYQQMHRGIPVFSGTLKVHQNAAGQVRAANGRFYSISPKLDVNPVVTVEQAQKTALRTIDRGAPRVIESELTIVDPSWYGDAKTGARLAYYLVLYDQPAAFCEAVFVDAHTGEIIDRWTMIYTAKNRFIYDGQGGFALPGELARGEGDPPATLDDVNRAYDYYGDVYDYYLRAFGRDSIDGLGLNMVATVNSTAPGCPNAFWDPVSLQMVFCEGAVTDDIVGHELTHGVIQFTADLIYQNQSGQLNESTSDIFGEMVDLFNGNAAFIMPPATPFWPPSPTDPGVDTPNILRGTTTCSPPLSYPNGVRWMLGEDAILFGGAIRDMWNPTCFFDPDFANSSFQFCSAFDGGGVHSGSGIPNHAFAIMTDGKTFNGYTVTGIGPIKSAAVWYRALATYFVETTDFEDAYHALNQAAADLIGTFPNDPRTGLPSDSALTADDAVQVDRALRAVEMNTPAACGQTDEVISERAAPICTLRTVVFRDEFEDGINGWTTSNSGAAANPYNWVQSASLPGNANGIAWVSPDSDPEGCSGASGTVNSLASPAILLPSPLPSPTLAFSHWVATENEFDGGQVRLSVNGGAFNVIPRTAYKYNPYNGRLRTTGEGNGASNTLQGQQSYTGWGTHWGTSVIDLGSLVAPGDSIQVRFDVGRNQCIGVLGWYIDDFEVYTCPDCNNNGIIDDDEYTYSVTSGILTRIGYRFIEPAGPWVLITPLPQFTIASPPFARGDVTLSFTGIGDFSFSSEGADVYLGNGIGDDYFIGQVFLNDGNDCFFGPAPDIGEIVMADSDFNLFIDYLDFWYGSDPVITLIPSSSEVNIDLCGTYGFTTMAVRYSGRNTDCNDNGRIDRLDIEQHYSVDACSNGIPDECECDCNANNMPDVCELANHTTTDCNLDGIVDECQIMARGGGLDCNTNSIPDSCEIAEGIAADCNNDGIPDQCLPTLSVNAGPNVVTALSAGQQTVPIGGALIVQGGVFPFEFAYTWEILSPSPTAGSFDDPHHRTPSFRPHVEGTFVLRCSVRDINTNGCDNFDVLTVTLAGLSADAGPDRVACAHQPSVPLGAEPVATGGIPPYAFTWTVLSGGPDFAGGAKSQEHPTYTPTIAGNHVIQLSVQDSATPPNVIIDTMSLAVGANLAIVDDSLVDYHPILTAGESLNAGAQLSVTGGTPPYLYDWSILSGPGGSFTGGNTANAVFQSDVPGTYVIRLTVTDQGGCFDQTQFTLTVVADPPSSKVPVLTPEEEAAMNTCGVGLCGPGGAIAIGGSLIGTLSWRFRRKRRI